jgi:hypothetical protein
MSQFTATKIFFGFVCVCIFLKFFKDYSEFNYNNPISYSFIDTRIEESGKSYTYKMDYRFNNLVQTIELTGIEYSDLIKTMEYPKLFYSGKSSSICSRGMIEVYFRVAAFSLLCFVINLVHWIIISYRKIK